MRSAKKILDSGNQFQNYVIIIMHLIRLMKSLTFLREGELAPFYAASLAVQRAWAELN